MPFGGAAELVSSSHTAPAPCWLAAPSCADEPAVPVPHVTPELSPLLSTVGSGGGPGGGGVHPTHLSGLLPLLLLFPIDGGGGGGGGGFLDPEEAAAAPTSIAPKVTAVVSGERRGRQRRRADRLSLRRWYTCAPAEYVPSCRSMRLALLASGCALGPGILCLVACSGLVFMWAVVARVGELSSTTTKSNEIPGTCGGRRAPYETG